MIVLMWQRILFGNYYSWIHSEKSIHRWMMMLCRRHAETTCFSSKFQNPSRYDWSPQIFGIDVLPVDWRSNILTQATSITCWFGTQWKVCTFHYSRNKVNAFSSVALWNSCLLLQLQPSSPHHDQKLSTICNHFVIIDRLKALDKFLNEAAENYNQTYIKYSRTQERKERIQEVFVDSYWASTTKLCFRSQSSLVRLGSSIVHKIVQEIVVFVWEPRET